MLIPVLILSCRASGYLRSAFYTAKPLCNCPSGGITGRSPSGGNFGIGASGVLADYTVRLLSRIGLPAVAFNRTGINLAEQLIALQRGDVLIMMAQKSPHREGLTTIREAVRLGVPVILLTNALDSRFSKEADVVINVPRGGENGKMPLHGTVLVCLEMIVLSVASTAPQRSIKSVKRINELYRGIGKSGAKK